MIAHSHSGPHLCPSLTRVRALPAVDRGHRASAPKHAAEPMPALSAALASEPVSYAADMHKRSGSNRNRKTDNVEYRLIFAGAFVVFFVAAVFERALPSKWATVHGNPAIKKPLVDQAKEQASISAGYAFMG
jgi:hypothetical protein